jgi:hypothetical protein
VTFGTAVENPNHVLHAVIRELAGALNIFTDAMLSQKAESLHTFAQFNPNRAAVEGGAVAVWLLAPKPRPERIRRRLVLATQNARDIVSALTLRQLALATISRPRPHAARTGLPFELRIFVLSGRSPAALVTHARHMICRRASLISARPTARADISARTPGAQVDRLAPLQSAARSRSQWRHTRLASRLIRVF